MMRRVLLLLGLIFPVAGFSQSMMVSGDVLDEKNEGLGFATVALLHPADSTLAFFGITDTRGHYAIRNAKQGAYLLQVAYIGYHTLYRKVSLQPGSERDLGAIIMKPAPLNLSEVQITGDHVPLLIKKDTIEYNAAAFRTKPDAVVEDLLRKLPGLEVDRSGNIKAVGEDVKNVLVDGKEFFGNDQKVATKNVPANAVKKVQVYDKKSDESEFTGISDGSREKTVNLVLKDDKKKALFGDVMAGGGTGGHYLASAKVYRFTGANQFAALGMINNINQFGFSFSDYLSFNGGLGSIGGGGSIQVGITSGNDYPVNFGQPVNGYVTSGAAGLNFSHKFRKNNRFYISYLGNASETRLDQQVTSRNFIPGGSFNQQKTSSFIDENWVHRVNFGWKNRIDSMQNIVISGGVSLTNARGSGGSVSGSIRNDSLINSLVSTNNDRGDRVSGNFRASYIHKLNQDHTNLKISGDASYSLGLGNIQWQDSTAYYFPEKFIGSKQYQDNSSSRFNGGVAITLTQKTGRNHHLEPMIEAGYSSEWIDRQQGIPAETEIVIDSLSPLFNSRYYSIRPGLRFRLNTQKTRFSVTARLEGGIMLSRLNDEEADRRDILRFTPSLNYEYEYAKGRRLAFSYTSRVSTPVASQLLPVVNNINPLVLTTGNPGLEPEYIHDAALNWWLFDQFSFTSLLTTANFNYTCDKINWRQEINDSLGQLLTPVNVPDDYSAGLSVDFSTPLKKLGLTFHASLRENWNRGITVVNGADNINTNLTHRITLSFDNRKKEKWDVNFGASLSLTNARYSLQESMNNRYFDLGYFGEARYTPNDRWSFAVTADVVSYNARTFNDMVNIPLIGAEVSFYFLKYNRGMLTLSGFDLLNRNTGIERISDMNYLRETRSNIIRRYVMLSFKYRLNKFRENSGLDIRINNRR
jgi:hypothetical protein